MFVAYNLRTFTYPTIDSEHHVLICAPTKGHMCQMDTVLYPVVKISWWFYALFINNAKQIETNCNYEVKPHMHNAAYNLQKNLWAVIALSTEKIQIRYLQKVYRTEIMAPFQKLIYFPNVCEAYSRSIYIPAVVELTNTNPSLTL